MVSIVASGSCLGKGREFTTPSDLANFRGGHTGCTSDFNSAVPTVRERFTSMSLPVARSRSHALSSDGGPGAASPPVVSSVGVDLFEACRLGNLAQVKELVARENVNSRDSTGRKSTPLHFAAGQPALARCRLISWLRPSRCCEGGLWNGLLVYHRVGQLVRVCVRVY